MFKKGLWDGSVDFYYGNKTFLTGLVPLILARHEIDATTDSLLPGITITDQRILLPAHSISTDEVFVPQTIRGYQQDAVAAVLQQKVRALPFLRGLIHIATAGGKTLIAALLCKTFLTRVLILVNNIELADQLRTDIQAMIYPDENNQVGLIQGATRDTTRRVTVATVQTLSNMIQDPQHQEFFISQPVVIADEVHHGGGIHWQAILHHTNATVRVGLSGTPLNSDNAVQSLSVLGNFGPTLIEVTPQHLEEAGHIAPVEYLMAEVPNSPSTYQYHKAYDDYIIHNEYRLNIIKAFCNANKQNNEPTLILVKRVEHGRLLSEALQAYFIHGTVRKEERKWVITQLKETPGTIVVATIQTMGEGINIPTVHRVVIAGGGRSEIQFVQSVGRGRRKHNEDDKLIVLDFYDQGQKHIVKHSKERKSFAVENGFTVKYLPFK